ncbi:MULTISPECIES: type II toxin-antitoxin system VapC family toxin [Thiorhodovibrio]|uniref:type II toxin-antitoxin system VapC family toxin n=1 Tax=Thiorhodovibrio TaxID=61593 RepID=UPI0019117CC2|nr:MULTISPECIES: type II toxin-antitoxin system VapC family toxin [Thiorhodovibrio]MBK5967746.1 VapC toxin family PIN domain ribonuclease [Thiorhodovibrio winogradskyi]WPL14019.1 putative nucleic acid-binding protein, contains PIN domain [Thiorhodovibrio litoralis]
MKLVLDASMALAWIFERVDPQENARADQLLEAMIGLEVGVPVLWHTEVANALLVAERRNVVTQAQVIDYLHRLSRLPIETDALTVASRRDFVMALGREHRLSAYDATYLELTLRTGSVLASFDAKLVEAARQAGASIYDSA